MISNGNARFYENKNSKEWAEETGYCLSRFNQLVSQYGFEVATTMEKGNRYSSLEQILKNWLDEENISYSFNFNNALSFFSSLSSSSVNCQVIVLVPSMSRS